MPRSALSPVPLETPPAADGAAQSGTTPSPAAPGLHTEPGDDWTAYLRAAPVLDEAERKRQLRHLLDRGLEEARAGGGFDLAHLRRITDQRLAARQTR